MAKCSAMGGKSSFLNLVHRISRKLRREIRAFFRKSRDRLRSSYSTTDSLPDGRLAHRFGFIDRQFIDLLIRDFPGYPELVRQQGEQSIAHCFDLLGSGPVIVKHGNECHGLDGYRYPASPAIDADRHGDWLQGRINRANLPAAKRIWRQVENGYLPIDWHLDFKSGYRWQEGTWHGDIRFGDLPGVDVKIPWELSRMQHLPTLALACHFAATGIAGFETPETYAREFRNQVLDFIATNPPGFGVNWACAMDVAIRIANLLVARDIIAACGTRLDDEFEAIFVASVKAHARHIAANLEWSPEVRGNHYIANIAGLLFAAIYLPCNDETDAWLAFSVQELIAEVAYQFHEDGSNFEASVCYHRLSSEMVLWASAFLANLTPDKRAAIGRSNHKVLRSTPPLRRGAIEFHPVPGIQGDSPLPEWFWVRLAKMGTFTAAMTRPDNLVVQFGDNDSGRFITLGSGEQLRAGNDPSSPLWSLDHGALIGGIRAVVGCEMGSSKVAPDPAARFLRAIKDDPDGHLATIDPMFGEGPSDRSETAEAVWFDAIERFAKSSTNSRWASIFKANSSGLLDDMQQAAFAGIGAYIIRSPRLYLAVRCGEVGIAGLGAHTHCDQLAIELVIDGEPRVCDPGTYIYTPLPDKRNTYRSARAHHVPRVPDREPADLTRGVFDLRGCAEGECLYFGPRGFIGRHSGYGPWVYRIVVLEDERIAVYDFSEGSLPISDPTPEPLPYSQGYGRTIPV
jgi:hypothetical protein